MLIATRASFRFDNKHVQLVQESITEGYVTIFNNSKVVINSPHFCNRDLNIANHLK